MVAKPFVAPDASRVRPSPRESGPGKLSSCSLHSVRKLHPVRKRNFNRKSALAAGLPDWLTRWWPGGDRPPEAGPLEWIQAQFSNGNALGLVFGYAFVGGLNFCVMLAGSFAFFKSNMGGNPILFEPQPFLLQVNPEFVVFVTGIYFSYGSISTPLLAGAAVALAPAYDSAVNALEEKLNCPRLLAMAALAGVASVVQFGFFVLALFVACAIMGTTVFS